MYPLRERKDLMAMLLQHGNRIFHSQDLALIWRINKKNTLFTTIKRYVRRKRLYRIFKGLYSTVPLEKLSPSEIGVKALHRFAYLSCETILHHHGIINAFIDELTFVSSVSKDISIGQIRIRSRKLNEQFLFNPIGIHVKGDVKEASIERAIADILYFNSKFHFDAPIDWQKIKQMQVDVGYPLTPRRYASS